MRGRIKQADNHIRKGCERIPQKWRKGVLITMLTILLTLFIINII